MRRVALRYERIADDIRRQIADGELLPGARLSSESALSVHYRVSVPTIRQALDMLQSQGLVEKRHGSGNYVRAPHSRLDYSNARLWEGRERDPVNDDDIEVSVTLRQMEARGGLPARLGVPPRRRLLEYSYHSRFLRDGASYALTRSYLLRDMLPPRRPHMPGADASPWGDDYRVMLADAGVEVDHVTERLVARPPSPEESEALGLSRGVAVLALERKAIDTRGIVVEVADAIMSGDRVTAVYTTFVVRPSAAPRPVGH